MDRSTIAERVRSAIAIAIGQDMSRLARETRSLGTGLRTEGYLAHQIVEQALAAIGTVAGHRQDQVGQSGEIAPWTLTYPCVTVNAVEAALEAGIHHHVILTTAAGRLRGQLDPTDDEMAHSVAFTGVVHHHVALAIAADRLHDQIEPDDDEMAHMKGLPGIVYRQVAPITAAGRPWGQVDLINDETARAIGLSGIAQGVGIHHHVAPMAAARRLHGLDDPANDEMAHAIGFLGLVQGATICHHIALPLYLEVIRRLQYLCGRQRGRTHPRLPGPTHCQQT